MTPNRLTTKQREAGRVRRKLMRKPEPPKFTTARGMSKLIESLARTLDDFHYTRMRTPTEVSVKLLHGRTMTISVTTTEESP